MCCGRFREWNSEKSYLLSESTLQHISLTGIVGLGVHFIGARKIYNPWGWGNQKRSRGMANLKGWVFLFITSPLLVFANYNLDNKEFSFFHDGNLDPDSPAVSGNILDNGDFESGDGSLGDWSCTNCHCSVEQFQAPWKWVWHLWSDKKIGLFVGNSELTFEIIFWETIWDGMTETI